MGTHMGRRWRRLATGASVAALLAGCTSTPSAPPAPASSSVPTSASSSPVSATTSSSGPSDGVRHVFVITIENTGLTQTWGPGSRAPYLARTLRRKGMLLTHYYGTAHNSLGNYLAQITGQGPNVDTQTDCKVFTDFRGRGVAAHDQLVGRGCVLPARTPSLPRQLDAAGRTWKGYLEGMGTPCRHPRVGTADRTQAATATSAYAARHNPFVYLHSVIDHPRSCARHVRDLRELTADLRTATSTPDLVYITPDLCHDGHDAPCANGEPGGLRSVDTWMRRWVPRILASPAYAEGGVLVITADESEGASADSSGCCGPASTPNARLPGITGRGGGRVGALVISPWVRAGGTDATPVNHYGLLGSIEHWWGLERIGYAALPGTATIGKDGRVG